MKIGGIIRNEKTGRNWRPIIAITLLSAMIIGLLLYMIIPPLLTREQLEVFSFHGFSSNSSAEIQQASLDLINRGTRVLTINSFWVNTTLLNSMELLWERGCTLFPSGSKGTTDTTVCLTPKAFSFRKGANYNFTLGTSSGKYYSFAYSCDDVSVSPENLSVVEWEFVPGNMPYGSTLSGKSLQKRRKNSPDLDQRETRWTKYYCACATVDWARFLVVGPDRVRLATSHDLHCYHQHLRR